jgi:serine/threonine protein kinase
MSRQIVGLAKALHSIHHLNVDESNVEELSAHDRLKTHGRHGDLKPENILWFKEHEANPKDSRAYGILKVSDLGSADFHGPLSKSVRISNMNGFTDTYKAPEFDMGARVSPRYDIWSLGCVLMQFIVWYLDGAIGVAEFSERRKWESDRAIRADDFFNIYSDKNTITTRAKPSVLEVSA